MSNYEELDNLVEQHELSIYDHNRKETLGRRRMNLEERLEYVRLSLNRDKEYPEYYPFDGLSVICTFLYDYFEKPTNWEQIDHLRAQEDMEE